mmetsp:Transcript_32796/g.64997  ORF Transcript_32796/g.64997 Transcript_32796/m.64997 type:complete len:210 (-) Transcript_32796:151-780(-)|eukprot:CAMPEP_0194324288 /NCGR_PEP_ID=MMETSP0171-20130528/27209_1 /TAXON_ID=218684 /ORGANISM="Corethron pennatum, Strain L29A3" /LENGTH=209 /DNA_ID=CAMNT_0039083149 /DNA_START=119 /DNA_END=748 /DNA_ORIENTATION=+
MAPKEIDVLYQSVSTADTIDQTTNDPTGVSTDCAESEPVNNTGSSADGNTEEIPSVAGTPTESKMIASAGVVGSIAGLAMGPVGAVGGWFLARHLSKKEGPVGDFTRSVARAAIDIDKEHDIVKNIKKASKSVVGGASAVVSGVRQGVSEGLEGSRRANQSFSFRPAATETVAEDEDLDLAMAISISEEQHKKREADEQLKQPAVVFID